jgi:hypothetical protein
LNGWSWWTCCDDEPHGAAITELNLAADFTEHGYEGDLVADLNAEVADVRDAEGDQGGTLQEQGGATASLPQPAEAGRGCGEVPGCHPQEPLPQRPPPRSVRGRLPAMC